MERKRGYSGNGIQSKRGKSIEEDTSGVSGGEKKPKEEIDLNEDEEAALDAVWEKRDKVSNVDMSGESDLKSVRAKYKKK